ncbi:hypothetical protein TB1_037144 [Malus domestica]
MVARMDLVTLTVPSRILKSSGILLAFFIERLASTAISTQIEFANVGTIKFWLGLLGPGRERDLVLTSSTV